MKEAAELIELNDGLSTVNDVLQYLTDMPKDYKITFAWCNEYRYICVDHIDKHVWVDSDRDFCNGVIESANDKNLRIYHKRLIEKNILKESLKFPKYIGYKNCCGLYFNGMADEYIAYYTCPVNNGDYTLRFCFVKNDDRLMCCSDYPEGLFGFMYNKISEEEFIKQNGGGTLEYILRNE